MTIKELKLEEVNSLMLSAISQYYDDRLFEIYNLQSLFSDKKMSFIEYRKKLLAPNKEVDVKKINEDTDEALNDFIKMMKKRGEE